MELQGPTQLRRIGGHKFYFRLRCDGKGVYLQTQRFFSNGPFNSFGKQSIYVPEESDVMDDIDKLLKFCKKHISCPDDAPKEWKLDDNIWPLFDRSGLFATLSDNFQAFDREKKPIKKLGKGNYILRLHLPGVYLGESGSQPIARLQVKVSQLIYEPEEENSVCLID